MTGRMIIRMRRYGRRVDVEWRFVEELRWRHTLPLLARLAGRVGL